MKFQSIHLPILASVLVAPLQAFSADLTFYEAAQACRATTEAHPFRVRFTFERSPSYRLEPDTPLTQCLSKQAAAQDELGEARRLSLGAGLARAVRDCSAKFGKAENFVAEYTPSTADNFDVRLGPGTGNTTRSCIAMLTGLGAPFGTGLAAPAR